MSQNRHDLLWVSDKIQTETTMLCATNFSSSIYLDQGCYKKNTGVRLMLCASSILTIYPILKSGCKEGRHAAFMQCADFALRRV